MKTKLLDKFNLSNKQKKAVSAATAVTLAAAILLSGTFAWQSISQTATNKASGIANAGGRLHDYFNGENKDVFVENFTDPDKDGVPIFARIRLDEYMEIGTGAGDKNAPGRDVTIIGKADAQIDDPSTWTTHLPGHLPGGEAGNTHTPMHEYWAWEMGGKGVYMPTFNMDKDSLEADINGTYEGPDGIAGPGAGDVDDRYQDYVEYEAGVSTKTEIEYYTNGKQSDAPVEHTAAETGDGKVITMEEWLAMPEDDQIGAYWVYDEDGWAYWAQPIQPGETTGLLLNSIKPQRDPDEEWYYAINVVGQFATAGDWGNKNDSTGFYEDGITDNGLHLLNKAADRLPKIQHMLVDGGFKQYIPAGQRVELKVNMDILNPTGSPAETYVLWSSEPDTPALEGEFFTPTSDMIGKTYKITATSSYDPTVSTYTDIYVLPADAKGTVIGAKDDATYIDFGDNTFKKIEKDGSVGDIFICGGKDEIIGNYDDKVNVVVLDTINLEYGNKFLGPLAGDRYWSAGPDEKLGTADDVKVSGDPWPDNITHILADKVTISTTADINAMCAGSKYLFNAQVTLNDQPIDVQTVTWTVSGNKDPKTKIDGNGILTIGMNESWTTILTITAESSEMRGLKSTMSIRVKLGWESLNSIAPGGTQTVTIDGMEWYVLQKVENKALLFAKNEIGKQAFGTNNIWQDSTLRTYLNGEWLKSTTVLREKAVETSISTRIPGKMEWNVTKDKVFLLSEADLFGTIGKAATTDPRDYTYGNTKAMSTSVQNIFAKEKIFFFLRSPYNASAVARFNENAGTPEAYNASPTVALPVLPALWVTLPTN